MSGVVRGAFDVQIIPQAPGKDGGDAIIGRMLLDKRFHGALSGVSKGQMLAFGAPSTGAASYVALEQFTGTLERRAGSFLLHHVGNASAAGQTLRIEVGADSGTGALKGLTGTMEVTIAPDGKHCYRFDYSLPPEIA